MVKTLQASPQKVIDTMVADFGASLQELVTKSDFDIERHTPFSRDIGAMLDPSKQ